MSVARDAVLSAAGKNQGRKVSDAELYAWIGAEYVRLQRALSDLTGGALFSEETEPLTVDSGETSLDWPLGFDRLVKLERQYGSRWAVVPMGNGLNEGGALSFVDRGFTARLTPDASAPGTYRVTYNYVEEPALAAGTELDLLPAGLEGVLYERVAAQVRIRCEEDPSPHFARADRIWTEQSTAIRRRFGNHPQPGFVRSGAVLGRTATRYA